MHSSLIRRGFDGSPNSQVGTHGYLGLHEHLHSDPIAIIRFLKSVKESAPGKPTHDRPTSIGSRNVHVNEPRSSGLHCGVDVALFDVHVERVEVDSHIWLVDQVGQLSCLSGGVDEISFETINRLNAEGDPSIRKIWCDASK